MKLDYIYHSGFAIEAEGVTIIIDYYKDSSETIRNQSIVHTACYKNPVSCTCFPLISIPITSTVKY